MKKINFENLPSTNTPINATNLNLIQSNVEEVLNGAETMGNIIVSDVTCKNIFPYETINPASENLGWRYQSCKLSLEANTPYVLSLDYQQLATITTIMVRITDTEDNTLKSFKPTDESGKMVLAFTSPSDGNIIIRFYSNYTGNAISSSTLYSNIQLEKGEEATEYTPNKNFGYESGSNENGSWIKYDDGTMICYGNKALGEIECSTEWGGLYQGVANDVIIYPQEFVEVKHLEITAIPTTSSSFWTMMGSREYSPTGYSGIYFIRPSSATILPFVSWKAVGRWK